MIHAVVFGATGFVGSEIVRQLAVRGDQVIAHVRPGALERQPGLAAQWQANGVRVAACDWQPAAIRALLAAEQATTIYIVHGTTRHAAKRDQVAGDIYQAIDYGLTQMVCDAIGQAYAGTKPLIVYLSSIGADPNARSGYLRARGQAEAAVVATNAPYFLIRPAVITGARQQARPMERAAAVVGDGLLAMVGALGGKQTRARYRSTTNEVLASAMVRLAMRPEQERPKRVVSGDELR